MTSLFAKFFPTPRYLVRPAAGLDISDQSVKFVELTRRHGELRVRRYGEKTIPVGAIEAGMIKDEARLISALSALATEEGLSEVAMSLPEEEAYVIRLTVPEIDPRELRGSLELQLEEHIPLPVSEIVFDYEILPPAPPLPPGGGYDLSLSAFPKNIIAAYSKVLAAAGLRPLGAEIEAQAIVRSVVPAEADTLALIVDFGKTRTSFFITRGWNVLFTATTRYIGGEDITKAVEKSLHLSYREAERLKIEQGLLMVKNRELFFAILPIVSVLRDELIKHYSWWESHQDARQLDRSIEKIIICGGQATLPGLVDYLNLNLDWPVELGNPWTNLFSLDDYIPPINLNQALRYTTSLGLALRSFSRDD